MFISLKGLLSLKLKVTQCISCYNVTMSSQTENVDMLFKLNMSVCPLN